MSKIKKISISLFGTVFIILSSNLLAIEREIYNSCRDEIITGVARLDDSTPPNTYDQEGFTALMYHVRENNIEKATAELERGADPNLKDLNTCRTALGHTSNIKMMSLLLDHSADPNIHNVGLTPVMDAIARDELDVLNLLISYHADLDIKNTAGETALMLAVKSEKKMAVSMLIVAGANIDIKGPNGMTALDIARSYVVEKRTKNYKVIEQLLSKAKKDICEGDLCSAYDQHDKL